jgi:DUF971 family protein
MSSPWPLDIKLHRVSRVLEVSFDTDETFRFSAEFLRVHSPSAEVKGHGPGQEVLQLGKEGVNIDAINPVGNYAVQISFDDGHNTGLYSWSALYDFGKHQAEYWQKYLDLLDKAGHVRNVGAA